MRVFVHEDTCGSCCGKRSRITLPRGIGSVLLLLAGLLMGGYAGWFCILASALLSGHTILKDGIAGIFNLSFPIPSLITIAAAGAFLIGHPAEGAVVLLLYAVAERLEAYATERAGASISSLLDSIPGTARVLLDDGETIVPVQSVSSGDIIVIRPGDSIPLDGIVVKGSSLVSQASVTGESMPVGKEAGSTVYAGSHNYEGFLEVRVTRNSEKSTLATIHSAVLEAQKRRSPIEATIDRFSKVYTPFIIMLAVLVTVITPHLTGITYAESLYRGLVLLVIACPCALAIATPVSMIAGITTGARNGFLIRGRDYLEAIGNAKAFVFDKTGTLTNGKPHVIRIISCGRNEREILAIAAALELRSGHPLAEAVIRAAEAAGITPIVPDRFLSSTGKGVVGEINGAEYRIGNKSLFPGAEFPEEAERVLEVGDTVLFIGTEHEIIGALVVSDTIRSGAADTIHYLNKSGVRTIMLTGDHRRSGEVIGLQLGMGEIQTDLLPEEKLRSLREIEKQFGRTVMVGDGMNDAPALTGAAVGVAMGGSGSDLAIRSAGIVIMDDDITTLRSLIRLSRRTMNRIRQNIAAAVIVKACITVLASMGLVGLWAAVLIGDMGLTLAVIANAFRK